MGQPGQRADREISQRTGVNERKSMDIQTPASSRLTVIKRDSRGVETWRYQGELLVRAPDHVVLEAKFDRDDLEFHGMPLCKGDRFVETYYTNRWYNIYEIHAREDDHLRGWYCNIGKPAVLEGDTLSYIDLGLDLLVFPDGRQVVLDEDEFNALDLSPHERNLALTALAELRVYFSGDITNSTAEHTDRGNQKT